MGNTHDGFDGAGVISPDDVGATIGARITQEAQSSLLVSIPLQRHLRLDIGLDTFRVKRLTHRSAADESPARA